MMEVTTHRPARLVVAELLIANVLRYGVLLCGVVVALGLFLRLSGIGAPMGARHGLAPTEVVGLLISGQTSEAVSAPASLQTIRTGLGELDADTVISLGLLLLIALPILRVALTVVIFLLEKDWTYFVITSIVLSVLLTGVILGKGL